jgi:putative photosynthetic complex assembly protein
VENTLEQQAAGARQPAQKLPPALLLGIAVLVTGLLVAVLTARLSGFDASAVPSSPIVDTRMLGFRDMPGGVVEVYDWDTEVLLDRIPSGEGSFLRGVVRSLVRQRRGLETASAPFQLKLLADQRLILSDPETGEDVDLYAFGPTNLAVFARLLNGTGFSAVESLPSNR